MKTLSQLQHMLEKNYRQYKLGEMTQKEYLVRIKPIDKAIDKLEMSILQGTPVLRGSFLLHSHRQES